MCWLCAAAKDICMGSVPSQVPAVGTDMRLPGPLIDTETTSSITQVDVCTYIHTYIHTYIYLSYTS